LPPRAAFALDRRSSRGLPAESPVQTWRGRARSRCRCGRGEPSPGAEVETVSNRSRAHPPHGCRRRVIAAVGSPAKAVSHRLRGLHSAPTRARAVHRHDAPAATALVEPRPSRSRTSSLYTSVKLQRSAASERARKRGRCARAHAFAGPAAVARELSPWRSSGMVVADLAENVNSHLCASLAFAALAGSSERARARHGERASVCCVACCGEKLLGRAAEQPQRLGRVAALDGVRLPAASLKAPELAGGRQSPTVCLRGEGGPRPSSPLPRAVT
jgi:hypothetical protein